MPSATSLFQLPDPYVDDREGPKGTDVAAIFGGLLTLTYWDLWCLLAAQQKFQGDLNLLRQALIDKLSEKYFGISFRREKAEDLITLLEDLSARMKDKGTVQDISASSTDTISRTSLLG